MNAQYRTTAEHALPNRELGTRLFPSFFMAGFECASHRRVDGVRLDLLSSTQHDLFARNDYERLAAHGIQTARDGVRWHLAQSGPGQYHWGSWLPMIRAAHAAEVTVIWDLCHYGWPDHVDVWTADFVDQFARFSSAAARVLRNESDAVPFYCPINEISFLAWAGGEVGRINPGGHGRGGELKRQLVRACIASIHAIKDVERRARFIIAEPLINVVAGTPTAQDAAERYRLAQFEAHEMLMGRLAPELGGSSECLDIIGANFYCDNQWYLNGSTIPLGHHAYRPLSDLLTEVHHRYQRPLLIWETGPEGSARPYWLHHVCSEVRRTTERGVSVEGICLYPILDYRGWDNDRMCRAGLFSPPAAGGRRTADQDLLNELGRQLSIGTPGGPWR